ncbi:MAG: hypothetical protein WBO31_04675 [Saprospiraceae bacterium]
MSKFYDQIEDYLNDKLSSEEKIAFESSLESDLELRAAVTNFSNAKKLAKTFIEFETRQQLNSLKNNNSNLKWIFSVAATLIIGVLSIYFLYPELLSKSIDSNQVYATLYEKPATQSQRSESALNTALDSAIYAFDQGNLQISQKQFSLILEKDSSNLIAKRYIAHIHLQIGNYELAASLLNTLYVDAQDPYKTEALYYLCMLDLMNHKLNEAKSKFELLKNNSLVSSNKIKSIAKFLN